jgi:hypothetical protein
MDSSETLATFGQQDIGRRQTNHNTEIQKAMMSNTDTTNTGGEIRLSRRVSSSASYKIPSSYSHIY